MTPIKASWLAALVGGEGTWKYRKSKSRSPKKDYYYWRLRIEIEMKEEEWVQRDAILFGVKHRRIPKTGAWEAAVEGYRAFSIVEQIRPHLLGMKAKGAEIILGSGPTLAITEPRPLLPNIKSRRDMN